MCAELHKVHHCFVMLCIIYHCYIKKNTCQNFTKRMKICAVLKEVAQASFFAVPEVAQASILLVQVEEKSQQMRSCPSFSLFYNELDKSW